MKSILLLTVLFACLGCNAQKEKPLYCNRDSVLKWEKQKMEGVMSDGMYTYIYHNGKAYQDTSTTPPASRLKYIGQTPVTDTSVKYELISLKTAKCQTCEIKSIKALKKISHMTTIEGGAYQDQATKKVYNSHSGLISGQWDEVAYLDMNKQPITNLLIFPNN